MTSENEAGRAYDDYAAKWVERMRSGTNVAHEFLEKPAMFAKLPELSGKNVLCVGCGSGEECDALQKRGANRVVGIDVSEGLIRHASSAFPENEFYVQSMEALQFEDASFDFVYSSLAMHYLFDWRPALNQIHRVLKSGGAFLFSTHHPFLWSAEFIRSETKKSKMLGYEVDLASDPHAVHVAGDYLNTYKRTDVWFDEFDVTYFHKPLNEIFREIRESGFEVRDVVEPKAQEGARAVDPNFCDLHQKLPLFMIFELSKQ